MAYGFDGNKVVLDNGIDIADSFTGLQLTKGYDHETTFAEGGKYGKTFARPKNYSGSLTLRIDAYIRLEERALEVGLADGKTDISISDLPACTLINSKRDPETDEKSTWKISGVKWGQHTVSTERGSGEDVVQLSFTYTGCILIP